MGEMGTLWLALAFCFAGGVIAMISLRHVKTPGHMHNLTPREKFAELSRAVTLLYTNRNIFLQYCAHYKYLIVIRFCGHYANDVCG